MAACRAGLRVRGTRGAHQRTSTGTILLVRYTLSLASFVALEIPHGQYDSGFPFLVRFGDIHSRTSSAEGDEKDGKGQDGDEE